MKQRPGKGALSSLGESRKGFTEEVLFELRCKKDEDFLPDKQVRRGCSGGRNSTCTGVEIREGMTC